MKAVVIDDELNCRISLKNNLETFCEGIVVAGMADGVSSGITLIKQEVPDLVFLDINMGDGTGFDLLNAFETIHFKIIFTTAFDNYAIKAFQYAAIHYLLKPMAPVDLQQALNRAKETITYSNETSVILKEIYENQSFDKITLNAGNTLQNVLLNDVVYIEADSNYSRFYLKDESKILVSKTLKEYESLLPSNMFMRIHRSYMINLECIEKFNCKSLRVVLCGGIVLRVSRRMRPDFLQRMK